MKRRGLENINQYYRLKAQIYQLWLSIFTQHREVENIQGICLNPTQDTKILFHLLSTYRLLSQSRKKNAICWTAVNRVKRDKTWRRVMHTVSKKHFHMSPDCNSKYVPLRHKKAYGLLEVRIRSFFILDLRWMLVVSFKHRLLYSKINPCHYTLIGSVYCFYSPSWSSG